MTHSKQINIDNRSALVIDGLLNNQQLDKLVRRFYNAPFVKNEIGRPDTQAFPHWAHELALPAISEETFWQPTLSAIKHFSPEKKWRLYRAYVNYSGPGDPMFSHVDAQTPELTCLWYIVPQWHIDWAGETLFYDKDNEVAFACVPKPGRLVVFDSQIKHSGRPPSRICNISRFTLALKLEPVK